MIIYLLAVKIVRLSKESVIRIVNTYAKQCLSIHKNIGSHALERTFASYCVHQGIPIDRVSKYLGNKSIRMTMLYLYEITDIDSIKEDQAILGKMNKKRN